MKPLVSICVPTLNRASALRRSLAQARAITYDPLEIVISDNASTDETETVCREAMVADSRVRYLKQSQNIGTYGNHNACIDQSQGEFLSFFHDHDERDLGMIEVFVNFLQCHADVGVVSSNWELINEQGEGIGIRDHAVSAVTPGLEYIERTIRTGRSSVGIPGLMIRRAALGAIRFDERGHLGFGDFVVWCQIAEQWNIGHIGERLWRWRQDYRSGSARTIESLTRDYSENMNAYCDGHLARWPQHRRLVNRWRSMISRYLFWALVYEVGLYFRKEETAEAGSSASRTLFEILDYRLSEQEFQQAVQKMYAYRTGMVQHTAYAGIQMLMRWHMTRPLAWATQHHASLRRVLRLK